MITSTTTGLGFSPLSLIKKSITVPTKFAVRAARDPNVQRAAAAGAQAYAPSQYEAAQQYADRARGVYHTVMRPGNQMPVGPDGSPAPMPMPMPDPDAPPPGAQKGNILMFGLIGAGLLALLLFNK